MYACCNEIYGFKRNIPAHPLQISQVLLSFSDQNSNQYLTNEEKITNLTTKMSFSSRSNVNPLAVSNTRRNEGVQINQKMV